MSRVYKTASKSVLPEKVKLRFSHILIVFLLILTTCFFFFVYNSLYVRHRYSGFVGSITEFIPIPAGFVNSRMIMYGDVVQIARLLEYSTTDRQNVFDSALSCILKQTYVNELVQELDISISGDEIDNYISKQVGLDGFLKQISWSEKQYVKFVVEPLLLEQKVEVATDNYERYQVEPQLTLAQIQDNLDLGIPFYDVAKQYSQDASAVIGGDIGIFARDQLSSGFESVWNLKSGQISDILDLGASYALIYVSGEQLENNERVSLSLNLIRVYKATLFEIIEARSQTAKVKMFIR